MTLSVFRFAPRKGGALGASETNVRLLTQNCPTRTFDWAYSVYDEAFPIVLCGQGSVQTVVAQQGIVQAIPLPYRSMWSR
jgi:hypothetical protein